MHSAVLVFSLMLLPGAGWSGTYEFHDRDRLAAASELPDWHAALLRHADQWQALSGCLADKAECQGAERGLRHVLDKASNLTPERQLRLVNGYVNNRRYRQDRRTTDPNRLNPDKKLRSYWATPMELLQRGGDCEDYATAKYFLLRELGFRAEDMRVVVVYDMRARENHAVLAVQRADERVWLLDNDNMRRSLGFAHKYRFAINEHSIWDHQLTAADQLTFNQQHTAFTNQETTP